MIARKLGLEEDMVELIQHAAPVHDMGKMGIPDAILLKPGKLTPEEYEVMQRHSVFGKRAFEPMTNDEWRAFQSHTVLGEKIMGVDSSPLIAMAAKIALTHHEKWGRQRVSAGAGGQRDSAGRADHGGGRRVRRLEQPAALQPSWPWNSVSLAMEKGRGTHFDPAVLDAFLACREEIVQIRMKFAEAE